MSDQDHRRAAVLLLREMEALGDDVVQRLWRRAQDVAQARYGAEVDAKARELSAGPPVWISIGNLRSYHLHAVAPVKGDFTRLSATPLCPYVKARKVDAHIVVRQMGTKKRLGAKCKRCLRIEANA